MGEIGVKNEESQCFAFYGERERPLNYFCKREMFGERYSEIIGAEGEN